MSAPLEPAEGAILSGVTPGGGPDGARAFMEVTGQESVAVAGVFSGFVNAESLARPLRQSDELSAVAGHDITMVSWRMLAADTTAGFSGVQDPSLPGGTLASVAAGDVDEDLVTAARQIEEHDRPVMLRPNWEMNAPWFPWGAFERAADGAGPRPGNSPADYRAAWIRARIVFEGGAPAAVDAELREHGLPPLAADARPEELPSPDEVAWVWAPVDGAAQPPSAPHVTADYYPGDEWVDWVGLDWYQDGDADVADQTAGASTATDPLAPIDAFYAEYAGEHGKPIALTEWGLTAPPRGSGDDPDWMADALAWVREHPRVKALVYFDYDASDADHRLTEFPRSAEIYRREVAGERWIGGRAPADDAPPAGALLAVVAVAVVAAGAGLWWMLRRRRAGGQ
ncbi:MAG: glycoside hydrolase family 26 protein [Thermoleophilia bacterium]